MPTILERIRDGLRVAREIFGLALQLVDIVKKHKTFFVSLLLGVCVYGGLVYYVLYYPARTIRSFYSAIEEKHASDIAWDLLFPNFRKERWNGPVDFENGFRTTVGFSDMSISYAGQAWNPANLFRAVFCPCVKYDVSFSVRDAFTKDDFQLDEQQYDLLWLRIAHFKTYDLLREGKLPGASGNPKPALELVRTYRKKIEIRKNSKWLISRIDTVEEGLERQSQKE